MDKVAIIKAVVRFVAIVLGIFGVNISPENSAIIVEVLIGLYGVFEVVLPLLRKKTETADAVA